MSPEESGLPKIYWEAFGQLNEHNLISFKSFRESFNGKALMEFYGYLIAYHKENDVELEKINMYVMTHHFPRDLLGPARGTKFLTTIKENEIYDFKFTTTQRIRFVILRTTDHPVLGLFSNDHHIFAKSYNTLKAETELLEEISIYFSKIAEYYYGEEVKNMYTEEDFWRDYGPPTPEPFLLPWQKEYHDRKLKEAAQQAAQATQKAAQKAAREAAQKAAQKALIEGEAKGKREGKIETARVLLSMGMDVSIISKATDLSEEQILSLKEPAEG
jgi:hypothetical protein